MKTLWTALIILILLAGSFFAGRSFRSTVVPQIDSVFRIDTIRDPFLVPTNVYVDRYIRDTFRIPGDTVYIAVEIPIERKEYKTTDYHATIEGYKPSLISMEVYHKTTTITCTEVQYKSTKPRWGIGVQAGVGIMDGRPTPYIGVGAQYSLFTW